MRTQLAILRSGLTAVLSVAERVNQLTPAEKKEGFILLFDGKTLNRWEGDPAFWSVENEAIVGSPDKHPKAAALTGAPLSTSH